MFGRIASLTVICAYLLFAATSLANFAIFQVGGTPVVPPAVVCNAVTGVATGVGAGTCMTTPATCNGVADDAAAFATFNNWAVNTWQASHSGLIEWDFPHGSTCILAGIGNCSNGSSCPGTGIKQLLVVGLGFSGNGDGATWSDNGGRGFFLGAFHGVCQKGLSEPDGCSARIATVSAGASCVTLLDPTLLGRFSVGNPISVTGVDGQGEGFPPNPYYHEYPGNITSVNGVPSVPGSGTNIVCFDTPLLNAYKSTWPVFSAGGPNDADQGGPATIYALDPAWDTAQEYRGLTLTQNGQIYAIGRDITFRNVRFDNGCGIPTQNKSWKVINGDLSGCAIEVDKINGVVEMDNAAIHQVVFQSSSVDNFILNNSTVTGINSAINGTPKKFTGTNITVDTFSPGAYVIGRTNEVDCTNCTLSTITPQGVLDQGEFQGIPGHYGIQNIYTMSGGVIAIPRAQPISSAANSPSHPGWIRLTVPTTAAWTTGQLAPVEGNGSGPCGANTVYPLIIISGTQVDLQGSTFTATCTGFLGNFDPVGWSVPGTNLYWSGKFSFVPPVFQVTDLDQDSINTYVHTTLTGGFPTIPLDVDGLLKLRVHPAPKVTCTNCTGDQLALSMSLATPGSPLGSYFQTTLNSTNQSTSPFVFGALTSVQFNVTSAYTGGGTPHIDLGGPFLIDPGGATFSAWNNEVVNPKNPGGTPGLRTVTTSGVTGSQTGDALVSPGASWFPALPKQVTAEFTSSVTGDPVTATVTIQTDQGVVNPLNFVLKRDLDPAANDNTPMWVSQAA